MAMAEIKDRVYRVTIIYSIFIKYLAMAEIKDRVYRVTIIYSIFIKYGDG